ncbi:MAG: T9SS type A sorting domain-containing protein [Ignavibacteriaceae bacterium]|nr:T9SS type A sorting domain-containing protein [Ignavibacteriaceae bacterium]
MYRNGNQIAFIEGKGTTTEAQHYSFVDNDLQPGIYNYRLNQIDFDGTQEVVGELTINISLPEQFTLEQNYPNPFNPSTTIRYSIPSSEFVTLKVYDVLGNEVATLVNEEKPAGSYEMNFNAAGLSSGIYFYALQAGSYTQTGKIKS